MMPRNEIIKRVAWSVLAGLLLSALISEFAYVLLRTSPDRGPQKIELTIPAGTAERVARGETDPAIPSDMVFVAGDTLIVKNRDTVAHKLGPLFIPAGAESSLNLDSVSSYAYACSCQPDKYIGIEVREATTLKVRLLGILLGGLPMGLLFSVYSILGIPYKKKTE